jgi:hypothetical protein
MSFSILILLVILFLIAYGVSLAYVLITSIDQNLKTLEIKFSGQL